MGDVATNPDALPSATKPLVLIADDDDDCRAILRRALEVEGFDVIEVSHGDEALEALARAADHLTRVPDAVILDVCMPGYSGLGILRVMRRFPSRPPTFVVTGFTDPSVETFARNFGAVRVFTKPVDLSLLIDEMVRALPRRERLSGITTKIPQEVVEPSAPKDD